MVLASPKVGRPTLTRVAQFWQSNDKPEVSFVPPTYSIGCRYMKLFGKF
jgi:hypothetical protein